MAEETRMIAEIEKNSREKVCVGLNQWKDHWYVFVRTYIPSPEEEDAWVPTKKGISMGIKDLPILQDAVLTLGEDLDTVREVAVLEKSKTQDVRVGINEYRGMKLIYLRTYMEIEGEKRPTQKGVSLKVEFYPQLKEAFEKLSKAVHEMGKS